MSFNKLPVHFVDAHMQVVVHVHNIASVTVHTPSLLHNYN